MKKIISIISVFVALLFILPNTTFAESLPSNPVITGPVGSLQTNVSYNFSFVSTDPNNLPIWYEVEYSNSGTTLYFPPFFQYVSSGTSQTSSKSISTAGNYWIRVRAKNNNNDYSSWTTYNFTISAPNVAPGAPVVTNNPSSLVGVPITFTFSSSDSNGDNVKYEIDWDSNGSVDETVPSSGYVAHNTSRTSSYSWGTVNTFTSNFRAVDVNGAMSSWTPRTITTFNSNAAPGIPTIALIGGQSPLYPNNQYQFTANADDSDSSQVAYWIDWNNDGSFEAGTILNPDNTPITISNPANTWTTPGTYTFRVRSTDSSGDSSNPVTFSVTIETPPAPTVSLSLNPPFLTLGQPTQLTISWSSTNASSCQAVGLSWPGHNTLSGTYTTPGTIPGPRTHTWVCTGNGMTATTTVYLGYPVDLLGWGWSSNIGWISFSSANPEVGAGSTYSVKMGTSTDKGFLGGWAWSSNIGWISFSHGDGAHPNGIVDFNTGAVTGWARACAATLNGSCTGATRPDWDGWISLSGSNHSSPGQGVTYDASTGRFRGFSWGSDVTGWLTVDSLISSPLHGPVVVSTSTPSCSITTNPASLPVAGGSVNVSWTSTGVVGNSCRVDGPNGFAYSNMSGNDNRTTNISSSGNGGRYTLRCNTDAIICSANLDKATSPPPPPIPKMWLDNDPGESKNITTIRQGNSAIVNWRLGSRYTGCVGSNVEQSNASLQPGSTWFNSGVETVPYKYRATIPNLTVGKYVLTLQCDNGNKTNDVTVIVKDSNSTTIEEK